jgi:hypothetical protein
VLQNAWPDWALKFGEYKTHLYETPGTWTCVNWQVPTRFVLGQVEPVEKVAPASPLAVHCC